MNAFTAVVIASSLTASLIALWVVAGARGSRSARAMVGRGEGVLNAARRNRLPQDVVSVFAYQAPAAKETKRQNVPTAALSAAKRTPSVATRTVA